MNPLLDISKLEKKVDEFQLGPIDLQIEPGTITAIVGNNGSGKSTLLKLIMNLAKPDKGNIMVANQLVHGEEESWKNQIAYQPQTVIGYNPFTGNKLKDLIAPLYPNWDEALFLKLVELFDIPLNKRFGKISQGAQQKLTLALTIPRNAPLLLLDEPTSFMDIPSKKHLLDILVDWMEQDNRAIVITSHQADDIRKLSDYLFVLRDGKMIGNYEKETLTENFKRYWLKKPLQDKAIPGEVARHQQQVISNQPEVTEQYFKDADIQWIDRTALDLEEIITLLLATK